MIKKNVSFEKIVDIFLWIFLFTFAFFIFYEPSVISTGVVNGLEMCKKSLIPSLFPFMVIANFLISKNVHIYLGNIISRPMSKYLKVNKASSGIFILSMLCGYPQGAKMACDLYKDGVISKNEAERLIGFCSFPSPAFCIGVVGVGVFRNYFLGFLVFVVVLLTSLVVGYFHSKDGTYKEVGTIYKNKSVSSLKALISAISKSLVNMAMVCAFATFFYALTAVIEQIDFHDIFKSFDYNTVVTIEGLFLGLFEVTKGIDILNGFTPFSLAASGFMLSLSGFCIYMQCISFAFDSHLSTKKYFNMKIITAVFVFIILFIIGIFIKIYF